MYFYSEKNDESVIKEPLSDVDEERLSNQSFGLTTDAGISLASAFRSDVAGNCGHCHIWIWTNLSFH